MAWKSQGRNMVSELVLIDDGTFYIERNVNGDPATTNGFLLRRCATGVTTPGGYECVGGYACSVSGAWQASINAPYDESADSDCRVLGDGFKTYLDAIAALWSARHEAFCKH
jgi:hypothetical protein